MSNTDFGKTITGLNTISCDYIYTNYDNQNNYLEANYYNYIPSQNIVTLSGITGNIQDQINSLTYSSLSGNIYFNNQLQNYLLSSTASSTYCTISSLIFSNNYINSNFNQLSNQLNTISSLIPSFATNNYVNSNFASITNLNNLCNQVNILLKNFNGNFMANMPNYCLIVTLVPIIE